MKFRKRPVVVEAMQWKGGIFEPLNKFCGLHWTRADARDIEWSAPDDKEHVIIWNVLEVQWLQVPVGHWIIRGIQGELYPCDPNAFAATYEPVEEGG